MELFNVVGVVALLAHTRRVHRTQQYIEKDSGLFLSTMIVEWLF
jgi:hypothetical protein